ncbi:MAG TPA: hypothetical protein PLC73_05220 [Rectinema sp.]|nr:hypothetical protein [Rectinema sp.]
MSLVDNASKALVSGRIPPALVRGAAHVVVAILSAKMRIDDAKGSRRATKTASKLPAESTSEHPSVAVPEKLYFVDGYHGGAIFWDWLILPGGGLWRTYNWPLCVRPVIKRALHDSRFKVVLDFDAYTYEWMADHDSHATSLLRSALDASALEIVNGTYGQPFGCAESGESFIRQLELGNRAIEAAFGTTPEVFYSQEPTYFAQLPQILSLMGYKGAVFRTQWAAFGTDPAHDADLVSWVAPDGSEISTVPRYSFQNYKRQLEHHPGLAAGSLGIGDKPDWAPESFPAFLEAASACGIAHPFISDLKDVNLPEAPLPRATEIVAMKNIVFTRPKDYLRIANPPQEKVSHGPHDTPCTLPWGLEADDVPRSVVAAESALRVAESLDAVLQFFNPEYASAEPSLTDAWKSLCIAQQHDLYVCGPWLSLAHRQPMWRVAVGFAEHARKEAERITLEAMASISTGPYSGISASGDIRPSSGTSVSGNISPSSGHPGGIIVFNAASCERRDYIEVKIPKSALPQDKPQGKSELCAYSNDELYSCQLISEDESEIYLGFVPKMQGLSLKHFSLMQVAAQHSNNEARMSPPFTILLTAKDGLTLCSSSGEKLIESLIFTCVRDGKPYNSLLSTKSAKWVANGPALYALEVEGDVADLPFILTLKMYSGVKRIDASVRFDFGDGPTYLGPQMDDYPPGTPYSIHDEAKLCVSFNVPAECICCKSPFWISEVSDERITGAPWIGLECDERGNPGEHTREHLAFINRGNRGYHWNKEEHRLRQVLAWAPREWIYASDDSFTRGKSAFTALSGTRTFEFAIAPYADRVEAERHSMNFATPLIAIWQDSSGAEASKSAPTSNTKPSDYIQSCSALELDSEKVFITAFLVQNGNIIARLWNASGNEVTSALQSHPNVPLFEKVPTSRSSSAPGSKPDSAPNSGSSSGQDSKAGPEPNAESPSWRSIEGNKLSLRPWGIHTLKIG